MANSDREDGRVSNTENPTIEKIDSRLTNEEVILTKLKADVAGLDDDDSNAIAAAYASTAQGVSTRALKVASLAHGASTIAAGAASSAQGISSIAIGTASTAQGYETTASGLASTALGIDTSALGTATVAEGINTTASGPFAHSEGQLTTASNTAAHSEGIDATASGYASHSEGYNTTASGYADHAEGQLTTASGGSSHTEGYNTIASAYAAHAEGEITKASNAGAHSEGYETIASGGGSHAEGNSTIAQGDSSHAEGFQSKANGMGSHAEGFNAIANGDYSHAEGSNTIAQGQYSHSEGYATTASGYSSHAEGISTDIANKEGAHIMGQYGDATHPYSWHLANGTDANNRGLAAVIKSDGQGIADQGWITGNADFAEMFETFSGKNIPPGYFVTSDGDKVKKASSNDEFILGVTSASPAFLGDAEDLRWKRKYIKDEWGRIKYQEVVIKEQRDEKGKIIMPERTEMHPMLNPEWKNSEKYIPRSQRPEWVPVSALGKVLVRDDGTCRVNGYCMPNKDGIATNSKKGYRVLKRTGPTQILIWLK